MQIPLGNRRRRFLFAAIAVLLAGSYTVAAAAVFLAEYFANRPDLASLRRAAWLAPSNADYQYRIGRYLSLAQIAPDQAVSAYQKAVALDPFRAHYWFELAATYELLGDTKSQADALEHAIVADPRTPDVAWQAANLYLVQGEQEKAFREFRVVLENDPSLAPATLQLCWRVRPDIDTLLTQVMPPSPSSYYDLLDLLILKKEAAASAKVWEQLARLGQPLETRRVFDYMRFLIGEHEVDQARRVWQQSTALSGLSAYQNSSENLVVNGDFSLDILNGGFDWLYHRSPEVSLALDPTQSHGGHRSLRITFDSRGLEDAGIRQLIPVEPDAGYDFSAFFKAVDMQGAGGPRFAIQDVYNESVYFTTEELKDADYWKAVSGRFTTGPEAKLVVLRIQRVPAGSPIKGTLWVDGIRLEPAEP